MGKPSHETINNSLTFHLNTYSFYLDILEVLTAQSNSAAIVDFLGIILKMATSDIKFNDKVVLVTGSSNGMGLHMSIRFAKLGAKVVIHGRDPDKMADAAEQCTKASPFGHEPVQIGGDMRDDQDLVDLIDKVIEAHGQLDVLVNNAATIALSPIGDPDLLEKFDEQIRVNARAPLYLSNVCAPHLEKTKGNIVNIGSIIGTRPFPGAIGFCTSKCALTMVTEGLALELGPRGIRTNAVNPGYVEDNQQWHDKAGYGPGVGVALKQASPLGKHGTMEDVVAVVTFLASDAASFINGVTIPVDGGVTKAMRGT